MAFLKQGIPSIAWTITSLSGLVLATGICISTIKASNLSVQYADFKLNSTARLSKVVELSKELEQRANKLQEKEEAYRKLKAEYDQLKKYNQPLKLLEPALQEVERVQEKNNLSEIEKELEATAEEAAEEIAEIAEEGTKGDRQKDKPKLE